MDAHTWTTNTPHLCWAPEAAPALPCCGERQRDRLGPWELAISQDSPWPPSPWMSPSHGLPPLGCHSLLLISAWAAQLTAPHKGRVVSPRSSSQVLGAAQDPALGWEGAEILAPHHSILLWRMWHSHPGGHSFPWHSTGLPVATSPDPSVLLYPMPAHPHSTVLSISSSPSAPLSSLWHCRSCRAPPLCTLARQQNPKELEKGAGGPGWDAMAIPRDPQHGLSCHKGPRVCLSTGVMRLPNHAVRDGTWGCVSMPLGRQSLRGGEGCNEEIGANLINWWVSCIKNTSFSDKGSAHRDICCDLHAVPKATVR